MNVLRKVSKFFYVRNEIKGLSIAQGLDTDTMSVQGFLS